MRIAYKNSGEAIRKNEKRRVELYSAMKRNPVLEIAERNWALSDPLRFFEMHAWIYEPRPSILDAMGLTSATIPFVLYSYQISDILSIIDHIKSGKDLLIEKSRTMGVTWFIDVIFLWFWLQKESGNNFLVGSEKEEKVDQKGEISTMMQKIRHSLYQLHPVFLPENWDPLKYDKYMLLINPDNNNTIHGESNNINFSRSGRYKAIFMDEFAFWEHKDEEAWTATSQSSQCRLVVSTPHGIGRKFADIRFNTAIDIMTLHWSIHPIYQAGKWRGEHPRRPELKNVWLSAWYLEECKRLGDDVFQELDIDYLSTGHPYFDNLLISKKYQQLTEKKEKIARYDFERKGDEITLYESSSGRIWIRKKAEHIKKWIDLRYIISADVAEGLEKGDFDSAYIYDRVTKEDVGWIHGKFDTDVFALLLVHFAKVYDNAWMAVESNNQGIAVLKKIKSMAYLRLMHAMNYTQIVDFETVKLGWNTSKLTRNPMCADLREIVKADQEGVFDAEFYKECMTFVYDKNGKAQAEEGKNYDDRVMAQAIKFQLHIWLASPKKVEIGDIDFRGDYKPRKETEPEGARFV